MTAALQPAPVRTPQWHGLDEMPADPGPSVVTIGGSTADGPVAVAFHARAERDR